MKTAGVLPLVFSSSPTSATLSAPRYLWRIVADAFGVGNCRGLRGLGTSASGRSISLARRLPLAGLVLLAVGGTLASREMNLGLFCPRAQHWIVATARRQAPARVINKICYLPLSRSCARCCASLHSSWVISRKPLPLQEFCPLQALLALLQAD
jgi:hypothetical protein